MNLKTVFRAAAVFMGMWILGMWFAPELIMDQYGWEYTLGLKMMMRFMGLSMAALATLHWLIPEWSGNNISKFGMVSGIFWALFGAFGVYDLALNNVPHNPNTIIGAVINFVFAILFYLNSKKEAK